MTILLAKKSHISAYFSSAYFSARFSNHFNAPSKSENPPSSCTSYASDNISLNLAEGTMPRSIRCRPINIGAGAESRTLSSRALSEIHTPCGESPGSIGGRPLRSAESTLTSLSIRCTFRASLLIAESPAPLRHKSKTAMCRSTSTHTCSTSDFSRVILPKNFRVGFTPRISCP